MSEMANIRQERIEKLLCELQYEIERGMMERESEEEMTFRFFVPISKNIPDGVVACEFSTRSRPRYWADTRDMIQPRLRIVK